MAVGEAFQASRLRTVLCIGRIYCAVVETGTLSGRLETVPYIGSRTGIRRAVSPPGIRSPPGATLQGGQARYFPEIILDGNTPEMVS